MCTRVLSAEQAGMHGQFTSIVVPEQLHVAQQSTRVILVDLDLQIVAGFTNKVEVKCLNMMPRPSELASDFQATHDALPAKS